MTPLKDHASRLSYEANTAVILTDLTGETITIPAGGAASVVNFQLPQFPVRSSNGGSLAGPGDTSLSLTSTAFTNEVAAFTADANLSNGDYWINPLTGGGRGKKADSSTSMTADWTVARPLGGMGGIDAADSAPSGNPLQTGRLGYDVGSFPTQISQNGYVVPDIGSRYGETYVYEARQRPGERPDADVRKTEQDGNYSYFATAGADKVIKASPGFLYGIIIGKDVASSIIEVSDHASDGDGNVKIYLEGDTLMTSCGGYVPVNADFPTGISADLTNQTNVTFVYR